MSDWSSQLGNADLNASGVSVGSDGYSDLGSSIFSTLPDAQRDSLMARRYLPDYGGLSASIVSLDSVNPAREEFDRLMENRRMRSGLKDLSRKVQGIKTEHRSLRAEFQSLNQVMRSEFNSQVMKSFSTTRLVAQQQQSQRSQQQQQCRPLSASECNSERVQRGNSAPNSRHMSPGHVSPRCGHVSGMHPFSGQHTVKGDVFKARSKHPSFTSTYEDEEETVVYGDDFCFGKRGGFGARSFPSPGRV